MSIVDISTGNQRRPCDVAIYGANRGALKSVEDVAEFNRLSTLHGIQALYTDIVPFRAASVAERARALGLPAQGREADVRELPAAAPDSSIISHLDDPLLNAQVLAKNPNANIFGYSFGRTAKDVLFLLCVNAAAGEMEERRGSALLLFALARHSAAGGSEFVFGDKSTSAIRQAERPFRRFLSHNITDNINRLLSGRATESGTHICMDGREGLRTVVLDHRESGWKNPALIAHQQLDDPRFPIARGKSMIAAEIGPDEEIRLHHLRRRVTNEAVTVSGVAVIDPRSVSMRSPDLWAKAQQERQAALAVADANTITRRRRPVYVTD